MSDHGESRPPIDAQRVTTSRWRVQVVDETISTNADVAGRFLGGEPEGLVLVAEHQSAGRGRMGRPWVTSPRASLIVSFLLVPGSGSGAVPAERWPWLPLLTGIAAARAVRRVTGVAVDLKWPNDVLSSGQKLGGILLERIERAGDAAAVVGIGINCAQTRDELPVPEATALTLLTGAPVDRTALLEALLEELADSYDDWLAGKDLRPAYLELCSTPGQQVRVAVPGGDVLGEAVDVDPSGRLVVRTKTGAERLGAGDVVHVRPQR